MRDLGRLLLVAGVLLAVLGLLLSWGPKLPLKIGRLPGDIVYRRENFTFYFPVVTALVLSLILSLLLWLFSRRP